MAGGDKIYIMAALSLQADHHGSKLPVTRLDPLTQVTDIKILAENTKQVAVGDKYGSGAAGTHQGGLLAKMRCIAGHDCLCTGPAYSLVANQPVHIALPWTNCAGRQPFSCCINTILQFTCFM
jgi:hypothetical protein